MDVSLPAIDAFVEELIKEKFAATALDDATRTDIKRELTERLNQYLTLRTIEMVSQTNPEAIKELSELIKTNPSPEQVQKFIANYVKEPDILVAKIFADFRRLYIGEEKKTH
jgi:predicted solute-binding protein